MRYITAVTCKPFDLFLSKLSASLWGSGVLVSSGKVKMYGRLSRAI